MPDEELQEEPKPHGPRALWSGTISFGLVSIPVELYPATRTERFALKTLGPEGQPLRREFFCAQHGERVDDIVRGFKVGEGQYVTVTDEELEALAPEKSRDIDLRRFVPRHELPMTSFERAHFMTPASDSNKAYRLLAKTLEQTNRVGIATFVMRGKEYLVAIIAERGLLRAETLRFADEVRTPADVGLPTRVEASEERVRSVREACDALRAPTIDTEELRDEALHRAQALVQDKLRRQEDIVRPSPEQSEAGEGGAEIIDLFEVLKRSLQGTSGKEPLAPPTSAEPQGAPAKQPQPSPQASVQKVKQAKTRKKASEGPTAPEPLAEAPEKWTKKALYDRAQELDISGRSQMTKPQLAKAIRRADAASQRKVS